MCYPGAPNLSGAEPEQMVRRQSLGTRLEKTVLQSDQIPGQAVIVRKGWRDAANVEQHVMRT